MRKNKWLPCFLMAVVCFCAVSCGVNEFSDISFSLEPFSRAVANFDNDAEVVSQTLTIKVYDAVTHEPILTSPEIAVTDDTKEYKMEDIPANQAIYVYMTYIQAKKIPGSTNEGDYNYSAWSGKSAVFTLYGGEEKKVPVELERCPYIQFKCTGLPNLDTLVRNNITYCEPDGQEPYSYWYATFSIHFKDGRTKNQVLANGNPGGVLYCAKENQITVPFIVDANEDCEVTINCYSVTQSQAVTLYSKSDSDTVAEIVKNGPTYTFYKEFNTGVGTDDTITIDVPIK